MWDRSPGANVRTFLRRPYEILELMELQPSAVEYSLFRAEATLQVHTAALRQMGHNEMTEVLVQVIQMMQNGDSLAA